MTSRRRFAVFAAAAAAGLVLVVGATIAAEDAAAPPTAPLTNEDIVRMVSSGTPEREILQAIQSRPEAFDLGADMIDELRLAGVSETIVAAMNRRHAASAPPPPPEPVRPKRGQGPLVVRLNAGEGGARTLKAPAWADEDAKLRFHLPKENELREVKDLAVFLACASSEHVPDLWRSKSPLGRDMNAVVRHEMLAFFAGDTPLGKPPRLTLPATIQADVDESDPHDVILGIAARIGDRWIQLAFATAKNVTIGPEHKPLSGRISHKGRGLEFEVELTAPK